MSVRIEGALYRRSPAAACLLTALLLGLGGWGVLNSPVFDVSAIRVGGTILLPSDRVVGLAGVARGENLLRLSTAEAAARLEADPWIAEASVRRDLPSTLVIEVVERRPAGWLVDPRGLAVIGSDARVIERVTKPPEDLPELGRLDAAAAPGSEAPDAAGLARVAGSLGRGLLDDVASVRTEEGKILLRLRTGAVVRYGDPMDLEVKREALEAVVRWAARRGVAISAIDLRVPSAPTLTPMRVRHGGSGLTAASPGH